MQFAFSSSLFREVTREKIVFSIFFFIFVSVSIMVFFVLRKPGRKELHPATDLYLRYCEGLAKQGCMRERGESPLTYFDRISRLKPGLAQQMSEITDRYIELVYKKPDEQSESGDVKEFKYKIRQFHMLLY